MKTILTFFLFSLFFSSYAQQKGIPENCSDCSAEPMFMFAETKPEFVRDSMDLAAYFNQCFAVDNPMEHLDGKILVGILVLKNGSPCCKNFVNLSNYNIESKYFRRAVNNMPLWKSGSQRGSSINYLCNVQIVFEFGTVKQVLY